LPKQRVTGEGIEVFVDEKNGSIISVKRRGEELLKSPVRFNLMRYTDNERLITPLHINKYLLPHALPYVKHILKQENFYSIKGCIAAPTQSPIIDFTLEYRWQNNVLDISVEYEISERIENLPRVGLEFEIDKSFEKFGYIGFGPYESYVDKHRASSFGYYESSASQNYDKSYIRPQESGSHLGTKYLRVDGLFELYADAPYSFSLNPYSTEQLVNTRHAFEIKGKDTNTVCIDLYQRGIGSRSCGPVLDKKYEIPRCGKNKFRFVF
jgi:beta-galactosidase